MALPPATSFGPRDLADLVAMLAVLPNGTVFRVGTKALTLGAAGQVTMTGPLLRSNAQGLTSTGATQGSALALTADINVVTTVAALSGVALPNFGAGAEVLVVNAGSNALLVYPFSGGTISGSALNVAYSLAAGSAKRFPQLTSTLFYGA